MLSNCHGNVSVVLPDTLSKVALKSSPLEATGGDSFTGLVWTFCQVPFHTWCGVVVAEVPQQVNSRIENRSPEVIFDISIENTKVLGPVLCNMVVTVEAAYAIPAELDATLQVIGRLHRA